MTVEGDEVILTKEEFNTMPTYQHSAPTGPRPGFRYKRLYGTGWWVFEVRIDPADENYLLHEPRRVKTIKV